MLFRTHNNVGDECNGYDWLEKENRVRREKDWKANMKQ